MDKPSFLKSNFFEGEQDFDNDREWCLSEQVDEYVALVSELVTAVKKYGFPDGTEAGDFIAEAVEDLEQWIIKEKE